jgi:hypothetical protein
MGDIYTLTDKLERALVKGTGFQVSASELRVMIDDDIVDASFAAKLKHLKAMIPASKGPD